MKSKKRVIMILGIVVITQFIGCFKSNKEVVSVFDDLRSIFPSEDLMFIYEKGREMGAEDMREDPFRGRGTYVVSSSIDSKEKNIHVVLFFSLKEQKAEGSLYLDYGEVDEEGERIRSEYPVYYDEEGLHLFEKNVEGSVKDELANFKFATEFLFLKDKYLKTLKKEKIHYSSKPSSYTAKYKLREDDENIVRIKELYPELLIDEKNCILEFDTVREGWGNSKNFELLLDEEGDSSSSSFSMREDSSSIFTSYEDKLKKEAEELAELEELRKEKELKEPLILDKLDSFISMFPTNDLRFLYDKEGIVVNVDESDKKGCKKFELEDGDLGTWSITSELYTNNLKNKVGVVLDFNRNTRKATGTFTVRVDGKNHDVPVFYNEKGINLVDDNIPEFIYDEFENFKMMSDFIYLDRKYLESLYFMNGSGDEDDYSHRVYYKLDSDDKNISKIKELYPDLVTNKEDLSLELESMSGHRRPYSLLNIILNWESGMLSEFRSELTFGKSKDFEISLEKE